MAKIAKEYKRSTFFLIGLSQIAMICYIVVGIMIGTVGFAGMYIVPACFRS